MAPKTEQAMLMETTETDQLSWRCQLTSLTASKTDVKDINETIDDVNRDSHSRSLAMLCFFVGLIVGSE
jgi:hypothetical protein